MKKFIVSFFVAVTLVLAFGMITGHVSADSTDAAKGAVCAGINGSNNVGSCGSGGASINSIIRVVLNTLSLVAGVLAVIMVIFAGMKYITSGGDAQAVGGAKKSLIYAIVGLIVVSLSQFIVRYVLDKI